MKSKKRLVIAIIIILILVLAVAGTVFGYLYLKTDTFKSDKELFAKYASQNLEFFGNMSNIKTINKYEDLKDQEKYESDTTIKTTYSEGGEVSNNINNLSATIKTQKNSEDKYFYTDGQLMYGNQKYLESEIIKDQDAYGIRFTDVVKQFITVKNDNTLADIATDIGTDTNTLENFIDVLDGTSKISEEVVSNDDWQQFKNKYTNLITDTISAGTFASNKDVKITYNNKTVSAKAYTVSLTSEQVENLLIQVLNNLKEEKIILDKVGTNKETYQDTIDKKISELTDEKEIPAVKITVYEQNKNNIRTVIELAKLEKVVIENTQTNDEMQSNIQFSSINSDEVEEYDVKLIKKSSDTQENIEVNVDVTKGEENYSISLTSDLTATDASMKLSTAINYKKDILTASIVLENDTTMGSDFEKMQTLSDENNFVLNNATEDVRKNIIEQLKKRVPEKVLSRIELLKENLGLTQNTDDKKDVPESEMTQIDINKFNAKFEFFTGDEVSAENVKTLLGIAKENLGSFEINEVDNPQNTNNDPTKIQYSIKLKIEKNKVDENGANQILEKISDKKKYKVSIYYKEQNKMIDYITIDEVKK